MSNVVNLEVVLRANESPESLIKRFMKKVKKSGLFDEIKSHEYYKKPSVIRREEKKRSERVLLRLEADQKGVSFTELLKSKEK